MPLVDIVIPIYNAADDLMACVDSVLQHTLNGTYCLILVDDASPDVRIAKYFTRLSTRGLSEVVMLRNEKNLGFVATANRGMALHPERDVVLLNSDTLVTPGWLGRIQCCVDSDASIGTVTPFSNNAEICSFPEFCRDNSLEKLPPIDRIAAALIQRSPTYPDIPTAVGFCMYIRRSLLDAIGYFDVETFGLGYGEENDFCMRATATGFRNVLCDDAFVAHVGGRSFDERKQVLMRENGRRLLARYPNYDQLVMQFIAADPLREIRRAAWERLESEASATPASGERSTSFWRKWLRWGTEPEEI